VMAFQITVSLPVAFLLFARESLREVEGGRLATRRRGRDAKMRRGVSIITVVPAKAGTHNH